MHKHAEFSERNSILRLVEVMLRNLPNNYTRDMFLSLLDEEGLSELYDFVYLPMDFCRDANLGYAFVNLVKLGSEMVGWPTSTETRRLGSSSKAVPSVGGSTRWFHSHR